MRITLTRDQWFKCIVELSKADELPDVQDAIRDTLAGSNATMGSEADVVLSKEHVEVIAGCV